MNDKSIIKVFLLLNIIVFTTANAEIKSELTIYQVMQRVVDRYPSLKISKIEMAQAAEQKQQIESSLGWVLNSSTGIRHDLTGFGTPSDRFDINSSIARKLSSGAILSLNGSYKYEDSSFTLSPLPNPSNTTRLDLSYRLPLAKGKGNPAYSEGIATSEAGYDLANANYLLTRISLTEQVKNIFYAAASIEVKLNNAKQAVLRAKKIQKYIEKNVRLGLSEKKDYLQAQAQVHSKESDLSAIQLQWVQQQSSLSRLMLEQIGRVIKPKLISTNKKQYDVFKLISQTQQNHPAVKVSLAKLKIAESKILAARDSKKDNLDLVLSVGSRTTDGKNTSGTVSELDWAGAVSIEYKHLFDNKGLSSKYKQAQLEKHIALQNIQKTKDDIRYTVSGLISEIKASRKAVMKSKQKMQSEVLKLKEAEYLFHNGRADTAQLIQFQNEYSFAQLAYQTQKVDLNNRIIALQIFTGQFWDEMDNHYGVKK